MPMLDRMEPLPVRWQGLWKRTLIERHGPGSLTNDRPAQVYWLQTPLWHGDIRIPLERPDFSGVSALDECDDSQLAFIAGQEAFCGITRVEGAICTWSRLFDLNPGTVLDVARMRFKRDDLIVETGIAEAYLEHWERVEGSEPARAPDMPKKDEDNGIFLSSGSWGIHMTPRGPAPDDVDLYADPAEAGREQLLWQASLAFSLCELTLQGWAIRLSTHPWLETAVLETAGSEAECA